MTKQIEVILFDLGGVLVELGNISTSTTWFHPGLTAKENWDRWLTAPESHALERGEITPKEFATGFIEQYAIETDVESFLQQFRDWVIGFYPGALDYVRHLGKRYRLSVLSNITEIHWPPLRVELDQTEVFSQYFASYEIGLAKPDVEVFLYVSDQLGVKPGQILFVDDNLINVEGARTAGMHAETVIGFEMLNSALNKHLD